MRLLIDSLIAVMLIGILAGVLLHHRAAQQHAQRLRLVHDALAQLHEQAVFHAALADRHGDDEADVVYRPGFPTRIDSAWFPGGIPRSALAGVAHPWIDTAPHGDLSRHPPDPTLERSAQAGFWYNPALGIFRARVPRQITEKATLDLYNHLNGSSLTALPRDDNPARRPIAQEWANRVSHQSPAGVSQHGDSALPRITDAPTDGDTAPPRPRARPTLIDPSS